MLSKVKHLINGILKQNERRMRRKNALDKSELIKQLDSLELYEGDNLFLHTRLSTVGYLNENPEWLIDYFLNRIGTSGNLLMPTFSSNDYAYKYLEECQVFDLKLTPSKMGRLTQLFIERPGVTRSIHATHSVACFGPQSEHLLFEHHLSNNPFGYQSPFFKFLNLTNAKVLSLGLTMFPMTVFRVYESINLERYPLPIFLDKEYEYRVKFGATYATFKTLAHNPDCSNLRRNMLFENQLLENRMLKSYIIGNSKSYLLDCKGFLDFMDTSFKLGNLPYVGYFHDFEHDGVDFSRLKRTWESA